MTGRKPTPDQIEKYRKTMAAKKARLTKSSEDSSLAILTPTIRYEEYYCFKDNHYKIFNEKTAERWAKEIVEFALRPTTLKVTEYFIDNGIFYAKGMELCETYPVLKEAYTQAKYIVGNRREKGGLTNQLNAGMIHSTMAMYDSEHKANAEWKANLAKDSAANKGNVTITIERYAPTTVVPERITEGSE